MLTITSAAPAKKQWQPRTHDGRPARFEPAPATALPAPASRLALAGFAFTELEEGGRCELRDAAGDYLGLFVNKQLAESSAAFFAR